VDAGETFGQMVGELEYSMFIVTVRAGAEQAGCLVGFGCQSSIDPPRFLACLSRTNHTYRVATRADPSPATSPPGSITHDRCRASLARGPYPSPLYDFPDPIRANTTT